MELLRASQPPQPGAHQFSLRPDPARRRNASRRPKVPRSRPPKDPRPASERVYVAVGRSTEKGARLLAWAIRQFGCEEIWLLHVHQPSPMISTPLGRIPANQVNEGAVSAYRREEMNATRKFLHNYLSICNKAQVHARVIMIESDNVQKGIADLVYQNGIRKLVMGSSSDNFLGLMRGWKKGSYAEKNLAPSCKIWFVSKGNHVWMREASEEPSSVTEIGSIKWSYCLSGDVLDRKEDGSSAIFDPCFSDSSNLPTSTGSLIPIAPAFLLGSADEGSPSKVRKRRVSCRFASLTNSPRLILLAWEEQALDFLRNQFLEALEETERSKKEAHVDSMKRSKLEAEFPDASVWEETLKSACASEVRRRDELEESIRAMKREQERLSYARDETLGELQHALRELSVMEDHAREIKRRQEEVAREMSTAQSSVVNLKVHRYQIRQKNVEAAHWCTLYEPSICDGFIGVAPFDLKEFSMPELESGTCNFSDSFRIGQGGSGCVYKGELLGKTVVVKQLHHHDSQGRLEFHKKAHALSKLKHPHLVNLIGMCPEAWCLVYEYLPNGSLQDHLTGRTNAALQWKVRAQIAAEICSALLFLHSSKPEKIIHGDLRPERIYLDNELRCKVGDFSICRFVPEKAMRRISFSSSTESKERFPYSDPEDRITGEPTAKSDVYALGIIVLQLLTGRPPSGLAAEVHQAVLGGTLSSILDQTAGDWPPMVASRLAQFGLCCSKTKARDRLELAPEVLRELEQLLAPEARPVPSFFLCPIRQEIMQDPVVAADGHTYEDAALRGWLHGGRETSPMTNLKLDNLELTPNHALRFAIQDWLCNPR
ncbi:unnamed protein product [Spirodela intermedia]|uniref:RING-type E3 ubiquitin transferase n=1 Tax=Spirodela intermedia TaxID=51605 RepID=A0A7I8K018_SPIIN|nr:unnamed protein product [Spirodela intermedia]